MGQVVLAIDPAKQAGWAVFGLDGRLIRSGSWDLEIYARTAMWAAFGAKMSGLFDDYAGQVAAAVCERPSNRQWRSAWILFGQATRVEEECNDQGVPFVLAPVMAAKKAATGNGHASKADVERAMVERFGPLTSTGAKRRSDEADARAIGLWFVSAHDMDALRVGRVECTAG